MSSKFAAAFGAEFPPCAAFPLTNKQVHVQISSSLCSALKFILILKRAALLLATSLRLLFLKPHWEFSPRVFFFFPFQSVHHAAILALSSALGCAKTSFHLYCFLKKRQNGNWGGLKWIHEKLNLWMIPIRFCPFFFIILSLKNDHPLTSKLKSKRIFFIFYKWALGLFAVAMLPACLSPSM